MKTKLKVARVEPPPPVVFAAVFIALFFQLAAPARGQVGPLPAGRQFLSGHVPTAVKSLPPLDGLARESRLDLAIALPWRNREQLAKRLGDIYDPASPDFHHYLTSEQFTELFGPTHEDYEGLVAFAKRNGFEVTGTHPNRALLDVRGSVANIERTLHVTMNRYPHPTEKRTFFAPDVEPSLDLAVPVLSIAGLNDFVRPRALNHRIKPGKQGAGGTARGEERGSVGAWERGSVGT